MQIVLAQSDIISILIFSSLATRDIVNTAQVSHGDWIIFI